MDFDDPKPEEEHTKLRAEYNWRQLFKMITGGEVQYQNLHKIIA